MEEAAGIFPGKTGVIDLPRGGCKAGGDGCCQGKSGGVIGDARDAKSVIQCFADTLFDIVNMGDQF